MPTRFWCAALLGAMALALGGCIFSRSTVFDLRTGATDLEAGRFEGTDPEGKKFPIEIARHGNLYIYAEGRDRAILSFRAIGDGFYLTTVIPPGKPIHYGVLDARSRDKLPFTFLDCNDKTPDDLVPAPEEKGLERCNATDGRRLTAIANRYKADMMAGRIAAPKLQIFTRTP